MVVNACFDDVVNVLPTTVLWNVTGLEEVVLCYEAGYAMARKHILLSLKNYDVIVTL